MAFGQATLSVNYVCMAFLTGYSRCELCVHVFFYVCMAFLCVHGFFEQVR